jgi:hypothetical protein
MAKQEELEAVDGVTWVQVHHPDLQDSYANVTMDAYEETWKEKGFVLEGAKTKPKGGGE